MGMCLLFAVGGAAIGAGIISFLTSNNGTNASAVLFIASIVLLLISTVLFLKRNKNQKDCCLEPKEKK